MAREEIAEATIQLARETMLGDVRDLALGWIKKAVIWQAWDEQMQQSIIDQIEHDAGNIVAKMAEMMAADGRDAIPVILDRIVIKDGMKITLNVPLSNENVEALAITGGSLHLVHKSSASYEGTRGKQHADPQEPALPFKDGKGDSVNG